MDSRTDVMQFMETDCCIVGAGPAGAMLSLLLARQGLKVLLLEAHDDFAREFRGDTLHTSTLEILDQLGIADELARKIAESFDECRVLLAGANTAAQRRCIA